MKRVEYYDIRRRSQGIKVCMWINGGQSILVKVNLKRRSICELLKKFERDPNVGIDCELEFGGQLRHLAIDFVMEAKFEALIRGHERYVVGKRMVLESEERKLELVEVDICYCQAM